MTGTVRLGAGTGWARDRFEPAADLVRRGNLDYLCFDSMSEVTMSAAQVARMSASTALPYDPALVDRLRPILADAQARGVRIVTNSGWLDPGAAAERIVELAAEVGVDDVTVAAVGTDDLTDRIADLGLHFLEDGVPVADRRERIVSAEAYLGAQGIVDALGAGADVVITTRIADGCLYLGPLAHHFGWDLADPDRVAKGMVVGHLMECGAQLSGGYFADPGFKEVPGLATLGNPIVEVGPDRIVLSKLADTGGLLSTATAKEQLLYEVGDPGTYLCPDGVVDFTRVELVQLGRDEVEVRLDRAGRPRTPTLKVLVGMTEGYSAEEMVIFAGPGALDRARLTEEVLAERFRIVGLQAEEVRFDYLGLSAVHREATPQGSIPVDPYEMVLRVAVKTRERGEAEKLRREIDPLAVNGAAATGKWATRSPGARVQPVVGLSSCLIPRELVAVRVTLHHAATSPRVLTVAS